MKKVIYQRNQKGRYVCGITTRNLALAIGFAIFLVGSFVHSVDAGRSANRLDGLGSVATASSTHGHVPSEKIARPCTQNLSGACDLTDDATKIRIYELTDGGKRAIKWYGKTREMEVIRTRYSRADSCHHKRGNECLTAIGKDTKEGQTVACPYSLKLGTKILLDGKEYICEDRYAKRLDAKRGLPTIDVFAEAQNLNAIPAYKKTKVLIYE